MNFTLKPQQHDQPCFRQMTVADLEEIVRIEQDVHPYPWSKTNFSDSLGAGYSCWVLEQNASIIGYAVLMMVLDEAHLLNISIAQTFQGLGLGRALLAHVIQAARTQNSKNMFLEVRVSNFIAIRLYDDMGFNEMSVRKGYCPAKHGREDAILMGLAL